MKIRGPFKVRRFSYENPRIIMALMKIRGFSYENLRTLKRPPIFI